MIYFPMTCDILTPGHIRCLQWLRERDHVLIGLLTEKALDGYKETVVPFEDRAFILNCLGFDLVPQESLNPTENLIHYKCDQIASGDGWEPEELEAITKLGVTPIDIKLPGETEKKYSSSKIKSQLMSRVIIGPNSKGA